MADRRTLTTEAGAPVVGSASPGDLAALAAEAARSGDVDTLTRLLDAGVSPHTTTPRGDGLLMLAACHDRLPAVQLLLGRGADPD